MNPEQEVLFYEFNIVDAAQKMAALASELGNFLRSMGATVKNPYIGVVRSGMTRMYEFKIADLSEERSRILAFDPRIGKREAYFQKVQVRFGDGIKLHLSEKDKSPWFERKFVIRDSEIYSERHMEKPWLRIGVIEYGPVIKKMGVVMDGFFYEDEAIPEEVTDMSWDQVPPAPSVMEYALVG